MLGKAAKGEFAERRLAQGPESVILETLLFWTVGCTYIWNDREAKGRSALRGWKHEGRSFRLTGLSKTR